MPSLKEIRGRINSISATLKITDVTRMISSAKLHKAQNALNNFRPYKEKIVDTFCDLKNSLSDIEIPMTNQNDAKKLLLISFSSNTGLCGAFNMNVIRRTTEVIEEYRSKSYEVYLYTFGKKVHNAFESYKNITLINAPADILEKPSYEKISEIAEQFINMYNNNKISDSVIIYNHFKNILVQHIAEKKLLPIEIPDSTENHIDYIVEPNKKFIIKTLTPQMIKLNLYEALLESLAAEFGARSAAMQSATDNAIDLISELGIQYNKVRQSAITGELIDIVGGAETFRQ